MARRGREGVIVTDQLNSTGRRRRVMHHALKSVPVHTKDHESRGLLVDVTCTRCAIAERTAFIDYIILLEDANGLRFNGTKEVF